VSTSLALRTPQLEWTHQAGAGSLEGLRWVDARLDPQLAELRQVPSGVAPGAMTFRQQSYLRYVPGVVVEAVMAAQAAGRPTAWEGMALLFARVEWLVAVREHIWAPHSPVPLLLATLVETFGVEATIHRNDPERLARLAALLPVWHPHRGTVARAREVLEVCDLGAELAMLADRAEVAAGKGPRLEDEVLAAHHLEWWAMRAEKGVIAEHRIQGGLLRFQPRSGPRFDLLREDVLLAWQPGSSLPHDAVRLLPAWTVVRLAVAAS
jgi:hypothetical protein